MSLIFTSSEKNMRVKGKWWKENEHIRFQSNKDSQMWFLVFGKAYLKKLKEKFIMLP